MATEVHNTPELRVQMVAQFSHASPFSVPISVFPLMFPSQFWYFLCMKKRWSKTVTITNISRSKWQQRSRMLLSTVLS